MNLTAAAKSAVTLGVLTVLLVLGVTWGWGQVTKPFPGKVEPAICVDRTFAAGDRIYPQDVTISVLNASTREGLAGRTMRELATEGFAEGQTRNAPEGTDVRRAEIWARNADNPAVLLLRSRFGQIDVVEKEDPGAAGIVLVVGNALADKRFPGRPSILAETDVTVCGPELT